MANESSRFTRMAPIKKPEGYSIYCKDKSSTRLTYEMCQARQIRGRCPSDSCSYRNQNKEQEKS